MVAANQDSRAADGRVTIQDSRTFLKTVQSIVPAPAPTPAIEPMDTWVVETGKPYLLASRTNGSGNEIGRKALGAIHVVEAKAHRFRDAGGQAEYRQRPLQPRPTRLKSQSPEGARQEAGQPVSVYRSPRGRSRSTRPKGCVSHPLGVKAEDEPVGARYRRTHVPARLRAVVKQQASGTPARLLPIPAVTPVPLDTHNRPGCVGSGAAGRHKRPARQPGSG